jgi:hypothetical protein
MVAQPVVETVMRQVPVTEYRQVRQTVRKPVVQTSYIDQPVTEYHQVIEQKTVSVPTVSYQDITECQTMYCNCGNWVTKWHSQPKIDPCQYDNRPGLAGEMNRLGFAIRQAFTPTHYATREYQQQTVAYQVPTTRRVAVQGTKQVTYNVARTVPTQTTRKVAVNTVKYVDEEVVVLQPVTVVKSVPTTQTTYRLVPAGSALAVAPSTSRTALAPIPDPVSSGNGSSKSANGSNGSSDSARGRTSDSSSGAPVKKSSFERNASDAEFHDAPQATREEAPTTSVRFVAAKAPTAARVAGWRPTRMAVKPEPSSTSTIAVAEVSR